MGDFPVQRVYMGDSLQWIRAETNTTEFTYEGGIELGFVLAANGTFSIQYDINNAASKYTNIASTFYRNTTAGQTYKGRIEGDITSLAIRRGQFNTFVINHPNMTVLKRDPEAYNAINFETVTEISIFPNLVTSLAEFFEQTRLLTEIPVLHTPRVGLWTDVFTGSAIRSLTMKIPFFNGARCFNSCQQLEKVVLVRSVYDGSPTSPNLATGQYMFNACSKLAYVDLADFAILSNAAGMFNGCTALTQLWGLNMRYMTGAAAASGKDMFAPMNRITHLDMSELNVQYNSTILGKKTGSPTVLQIRSIYDGFLSEEEFPIDLRGTSMLSTDWTNFMNKLPTITTGNKIISYNYPTNYQIAIDKGWTWDLRPNS